MPFEILLRCLLSKAEQGSARKWHGCLHAGDTVADSAGAPSGGEQRSPCSFELWPLVSSEVPHFSDKVTNIRSGLWVQLTLCCAVQFTCAKVVGVVPKAAQCGQTWFASEEVLASRPTVPGTSNGGNGHALLQLLQQLSRCSGHYAVLQFVVRDPSCQVEISEVSPADECFGLLDALSPIEGIVHPASELFVTSMQPLMADLCSVVDEESSKIPSQDIANQKLLGSSRRAPVSGRSGKDDTSNNSAAKAIAEILMREAERSTPSITMWWSAPTTGLSVDLSTLFQGEAAGRQEQDLRAQMDAQLERAGLLWEAPEEDAAQADSAAQLLAAQPGQSSESILQVVDDSYKQIVEKWEAGDLTAMDAVLSAACEQLGSIVENPAAKVAEHVATDVALTMSALNDKYDTSASAEASKLWELKLQVALRFQLARLEQTADPLPEQALQQIHALLRGIQVAFDKSGGNFAQFLDDAVATVFGKEFPSTVGELYDEYDLDMPEMDAEEDPASEAMDSDESGAEAPSPKPLFPLQQQRINEDPFHSAIEGLQAGENGLPGVPKKFKEKVHTSLLTLMALQCPALTASPMLEKVEVQGSQAKGWRSEEKESV